MTIDELGIGDDEDVEEFGYAPEEAGSDTHVPMVEPPPPPRGRAVREPSPSPGPGAMKRKLPKRFADKGVAQMLVTLRNGAQILYE